MFFSFQNSSLEHLDMSALGMVFPYALLDNFQALQTLVLTDNPDLCCEYHCHQIFWKNKITKITELYLENTGLTEHKAEDLLEKRHWSDLKTLKLDRNKIRSLDLTFVRNISGLESLSISQNYLLEPTMITAKLLRLKHLKHLNMSGQMTNHFQVTMHRKIKRSPFQPICLMPGSEACPFHLPENLSSLDLSFSGFQIAYMPPLVLMSKSSLQFVDLSGNDIHQFSEPFYYRPDSDDDNDNRSPITDVNLSFNKIECFNIDFFKLCNWSSLNILNLAFNNMNQFSANRCNNKSVYFLDFLQPLWNLTKLDLSGNVQDTDLKANTFQCQEKLEELRLANITITQFPVKLTKMLELRTLDLSYNRLECLDLKTMREISSIVESQKSKFGKPLLNINLLGNPLQCNCQCYFFYRWYKASISILSEKDKLFCFMDNAKYSLSMINSLLVELNAKCYPNSWLYSNIQAVASAFFLISVFSLLKRKTHKIYFWLLKLQVLLASKLVTEEAKTFHAFISYAEQDKKWVIKRLLKHLEDKMKLKLFVASRDFEPGQLISANIHFAITASSKTVFVISKSFLRSAWCLEEFSMALTVSGVSHYDLWNSSVLQEQVKPSGFV